MEAILEPGSYIVIPRTSGVAIKRPQVATDPENIQLITAEGHLTEIFESTISDIFKKFDLVITGTLDHKEFSDFLKVIGEPSINEIQYMDQVLAKCNSTTSGMTALGFKEWWISQLEMNGPEKIWKYIEKLGYDRDLYALRSRLFNISFHSKSLEGTAQVEVKIRNAVGTDIDNIASQLILKTLGKDVERGDGYRIVEYFSP